MRMSKAKMGLVELYYEKATEITLVMYCKYLNLLPERET